MKGFNLEALVKSPKRSRQDLSHTCYAGGRIGQLTPTLSEFIVPSDEVSMNMDQLIRLAPMPVPTFTELKVRHDFFFVPLRLLYNDTDYQDLLNYPAASRASFKLDNTYDSVFGARPANAVFKGEHPLPIPGSLADYLGYPVISDMNNGGAYNELLSEFIQDPTVENANGVAQDFAGDDVIGNTPAVLCEPVFAYHFIWRDWYRFTGIEGDQMKVQNAEYNSYFNNHILSAFVDRTGNPITAFSLGDNLALDNTVNMYVPYVFYMYQLFSFRYAHFSKDGFTSARFGSKPTVLIPVNGNIPQLREASAWQRVVDLFSIAGTRTIDRIRAVFNVTPTGFADDRVQFICRYQSYIKIGEVLTTATTQQSQTGDYAGRGFAIGSKYLFKRRFSEYGWLMCITSVMPNVAYTGLSRQLTDINLLDTPFPQLAEVGDQSIYGREINFRFAGTSGEDDYTSTNLPIGNQFRYYAYKWHPSEVHGSFRMSSMQPWVPTQKDVDAWNIVEWTKPFASYWNKLFNDTSDEYVYGDRFFMKLDFTCYITRCLPKYINYHL